jgi:hypothetical protein
LTRRVKVGVAASLGAGDERCSSVRLQGGMCRAVSALRAIRTLGRRPSMPESSRARYP